jgi:hypothetical protein
MNACAGRDSGESRHGREVRARIRRAQQLGPVSSDDHREEREKQGAKHEDNGDLGERMDSTADGGHGLSGARTGEQTEGGARACEQAPRRGRRADECSRKQGAGASSKRGTGRSSGRAGAPRRHGREESWRQPRRRPNRNQGWSGRQRRKAPGRGRRWVRGQGLGTMGKRRGEASPAAGVHGKKGRVGCTREKKCPGSPRKRQIKSSQEKNRQGGGRIETVGYFPFLFLLFFCF